MIGKASKSRRSSTVGVALVQGNAARGLQTKATMAKVHSRSKDMEKSANGMDYLNGLYGASKEEL